MSEPAPAEPAEPAAAAAPAEPATAGALLRQARQARGLHIAALATAIKVAPRKLELLEADRFDELPDATFTRALAQTVCRSLKIDAAPVLALLPQAQQGHRLEHLSQGLNAPFRDKPRRVTPTDLGFLKNAWVIGALVLAVGAVTVYLAPAGWIGATLPGAAGGAASTAARNAPAGSEPGPTMPPNTVVESVALPGAGPGASTATPLFPPGTVSTSPAATPAAASGPAVPAASTPATAVSPSAVAAASTPRVTSGALLVKASAESWVEVIDGRDTVLVSRLLQPGESLGLDGASPLRVRIGNASATSVTYRGRAIELAPTRDNVAKLELK